MGKLVGGGVLLVIAFSLLLAAATVRAQRPGPISSLLRLAGYGVVVLALLVGTGSALVVIDPGEVGVRHAFGYVDPTPLLSGIRFVAPWSTIERYSATVKSELFSSRSRIPAASASGSDSRSTSVTYRRSSSIVSGSPASSAR